MLYKFFFNLLLHQPPMEVEVILTPMEVFRPPFDLHLRSVRPPLMDQWSSLKKKEERGRKRERKREEERINEGQFGEITYFGAISTKLIKLVILPQNQSNLVLFLSISSCKNTMIRIRYIVKLNGCL